MLLELAVGDAYGAAFKYVDSGIVEAHNDGMHYHSTRAMKHLSVGTRTIPR